MGLIRGSLFVFVATLFFITLIVMNSLMVIDFSLDYKNIKAELVPVLQDTLKEEINITELIEVEKYPLMQKYCENQSLSALYVFKEQNYTFTVPCLAVLNGTDAVIDASVEKLVYDYYYQQYDCKFWDCFQAGSIPFFLISKHSQDYWKTNLYLSILAALVLVILMFFLIEKKTNLPIVAGALVIVSSLSFAKLESLTKWIMNTMGNVPTSLLAEQDSFLRYFAIIFTQSNKVFVMMLIIGIVLLAVGIFLKFFSIGSKINEFFSGLGEKLKARETRPSVVKLKEDKKEDKKRESQKDKDDKPRKGSK